MVWSLFPAKMLYVLQLLGDKVPQTPYHGFALIAPGPYWRTSVPQTPYTGSPS